MAKNSIRVLPCPFCGEIPKLHDTFKLVQIPYRIVCEGVDCLVKPGFSAESTEYIEHYWNNRDLCVSDAEEMKKEIYIEE